MIYEHSRVEVGLFVHLSTSLLSTQILATRIAMAQTESLNPANASHLSRNIGSAGASGNLQSSYKTATDLRATRESGQRTTGHVNKDIMSADSALSVQFPDAYAAASMAAGSGISTFSNTQSAIMNAAERMMAGNSHNGISLSTNASPLGLQLFQPRPGPVRRQAGHPLYTAPIHQELMITSWKHLHSQLVHHDLIPPRSPANTYATWGT